MNGLELINLVDLRACMSPSGPLDKHPYMHWSPLTTEMFGRRSNLCKHGSFHEVAVDGCSNRKCLPALSWRSAIDAAKLRCFMASLYILALSLAFNLEWFKFLLKSENHVQGGDNITQSGFVSSMSFTPILRSAGNQVLKRPN